MSELYMVMFRMIAIVAVGVFGGSFLGVRLYYFFENRRNSR